MKRARLVFVTDINDDKKMKSLLDLGWQRHDTVRTHRRRQDRGHSRSIDQRHK